MSGRIVRSNKETSSFEILAKDGIEKTVTYDDSTKWMIRGSAAEAAEFKEGSIVVVHGKRKPKGRVLATQINVQKQ